MFRKRKEIDKRGQNKDKKKIYLSRNTLWIAINKHSDYLYLNNYKIL